MHKIIRDIERPPEGYVARLRAIGAVYPVAFAGPLGLGSDIALTPAIRPMRQGMEILGPAFTVLAEDHLMALYATTLIQPGDVLVIAAGG